MKFKVNSPGGCCKTASNWPKQVLNKDSNTKDVVSKQHLENVLSNINVIFIVQQCTVESALIDVKTDRPGFAHYCHVFPQIFIVCCWHH